ncbi:uncharacterized protein LDX57_009080 [Aspergillus melleus]|uniref:uncharacterized protein n=1 Tax=Aspergillus melleus TaxID=138277 RepID=UPI001E8E240D|nr:uncharacterized protein LDX57_009080 [Aspergillus melleus]KAH8431418.1 hypothetical protein LDX57_009080 [Aspergillus melleus]
MMAHNDTVVGFPVSGQIVWSFSFFSFRFFCFFFVRVPRNQGEGSSERQEIGKEAHRFNQQPCLPLPSLLFPNCRPTTLPSKPSNAWKILSCIKDDPGDGAQN